MSNSLIRLAADATLCSWVVGSAARHCIPVISLTRGGPPDRRSFAAAVDPKDASRLESALEVRNLIKANTPKIETHRYWKCSEAHFGRLLSVSWACQNDSSWDGLSSGRRLVDLR